MTLHLYDTTNAARSLSETFWERVRACVPLGCRLVPSSEPGRWWYRDGDMVRTFRYTDPDGHAPGERSKYRTWQRHRSRWLRGCA